MCVLSIQTILKNIVIHVVENFMVSTLYVYFYLMIRLLRLIYFYVCQSVENFRNTTSEEKAITSAYSNKRL